MCRCSERRTVIVQAASGLISGSEAARIVVQTMREDVAAQVSAARARLAARLRR